jgi:DNA-binding Xre family transcriptional regulator
MSGRVFNRFSKLLYQKQADIGRVITIQEIKNTTGVAATTISAWLNNRVTRYDADTIAAFCDYLNCTVGDLIVYNESGE